MALRATKPQPVNKRLKLFMFGGAGAGKTRAAIQLPRGYIIDAERGSENYDNLITAAGSVVLQTSDFFEVVAEIKALLTERHEYRTLTIDPITPIYNDLLEKMEARVGSEFGRHYGAANKEMKRLANLIMALDMNVIITAHAKTEYGENLKKLGETFDGWRQLDYWFDLVIYLHKRGKKRMARVMKTRIETFPDDDVFEWSYEALTARVDAATFDREANAIALATPEQVERITALTNVVRLPDGLVEKWWSKANVDAWADMPADALAKCIEYLESRFPTAAGPAREPHEYNGNGRRSAPPPPPARAAATTPPPPAREPVRDPAPAGEGEWLGPVPGNAATGGRDYRSNAVFMRDWVNTAARRFAGMDKQTAAIFLGGVAKSGGHPSLDSCDNAYRNSMMEALECGLLDKHKANPIAHPAPAREPEPAEPPADGRWDTDAAGNFTDADNPDAGTVREVLITDWQRFRDAWDEAAIGLNVSPETAAGLLAKVLERVGWRDQPESTTVEWRAEVLAAFRAARIDPTTGAIIDAAPPATDEQPASDPPPATKEKRAAGGTRRRA